jgi:hypothetical protein
LRNKEENGEEERSKITWKKIKEKRQMRKVERKRKNQRGRK